MAKDQFDIHNCYVEFVEGKVGKVRPILIMDWATLDSELVYFYKITSQYEEKSEQIKEMYYPIVKWQEAGLSKASYVDTFSIEALRVDVLVAEASAPQGRLHDDDIAGFYKFVSKRLNNK